MIDLQTARLHLAFGALLVLGVLLSSGSAPEWLTGRPGEPDGGRARSPSLVGLAGADAGLRARRSAARATRFWQRMTLTGLGARVLALLDQPSRRARPGSGPWRRRARARSRPRSCT